MKHVLITGVSKGLGFEIVKVFLENDWCVWGISRTKTPDLDKIINEFPERFHWKAFDLTLTEEVYQSIFKEFIGINVSLNAVINNAAIAYNDIITNIHIEQLETMFKVNVYTSMVITKYAIRNMILHRTKGSILHISSISVHTGYKGLSTYAASKGAMEAFSKNTAREWGEKGIRSNCIVAGFMNTSMSATLSDEQKNRIYKRTSLKKETSIRSVCNTVFYLSGDNAESITGQNIFVDSGTI